MKKEKPKSAYELQKEIAKNLYKTCLTLEQLEEKRVFSSEKIKNLCKLHAELLNDFRSVCEINTITTTRFDEITKLFPLVSEIDLLLKNIEKHYTINSKIYNERVKGIKSFKKICVALQQNNEKIRPKSYTESVEIKEVFKND